MRQVVEDFGNPNLEKSIANKGQIEILAMQARIIYLESILDKNGIKNY